MNPTCQEMGQSVNIGIPNNMELTSPSTNTLKISTKRGYVLVDPDTSDDARIVILSDNFEKDLVQTDDNLIIYGPGDFEASGILIKGTRPENETMYSVDSGEGRLLVVMSSSIAKLADEDDYDAVVIKAVGPVEEALVTAISSKLVVVFGDASFVPDSVKAVSTPKINIRKIEELGSNVVYLEKK